MITKDSPAARAFIDFLKTPIAHEIWMAQSGFLTPFKSANTDAYANEPLKKQGEILVNATTFRFDGSDLMPGKIGAGAFWTGMVDFVGGKAAARRRRPTSRRPGTPSSKRVCRLANPARAAVAARVSQSPASGCQVRAARHRLSARCGR